MAAFARAQKSPTHRWRVISALMAGLGLPDPRLWARGFTLRPHAARADQPERVSPRHRRGSAGAGDAIGAESGPADERRARRIRPARARWKRRQCGLGAGPGSRRGPRCLAAAPRHRGRYPRGHRPPLSHHHPADCSREYERRHGPQRGQFADRARHARAAQARGAVECRELAEARLPGGEAGLPTGTERRQPCQPRRRAADTQTAGPDR